MTGKIDGLGADPATGQVIVTVNEDSKSSLYTVSGGTVTHYTYTPSVLPHRGGTDAVAVDNGKILISASAPGTSGKAPASAPAVYAVTLNSGANTASVAPFFADNAAATGVNTGKKVTLALTDPDSNLVVPSSSPEFAGDFMLNSQGDQELIFSGANARNLQALKISKPVDHTAWATSAGGALYTTDSGANTVDAINGSFKPGTAYTAVAPCNANSAPTVCPLPPLPGRHPGHHQPENRCGRRCCRQRGGRAQGPDLRPVTGTTRTGGDRQQTGVPRRSHFPGRQPLIGAARVFPDAGHHLIPRLGPGAAVERRLRVILDDELRRPRRGPVGEQFGEPQRHVDPGGHACCGDDPAVEVLDHPLRGGRGR